MRRGVNNLGRRDLIWLVCVLGAIIICLLTVLLVDIKFSFEMISFGATLLSLTLAVIAIFVTLIYSKDSKDISKETGELLGRMDEKLNTVRENVLRIDEKEVYTKKPEYNQQPKEESIGMTRIHGIISSSHKWEGKAFINTFNANLTEKESKVIDYSILPISVPDSVFRNQTTLSVIVKGNYKEDDIITIFDRSLEEIGVGSYKRNMYFNGNL